MSDPLAVWDTREADWPYDWHRKTEWARQHGVPVSRTYRVEFYLLDAPFARVFCYHLDAEGNRHWNGAHKLHGEEHDHSPCGPATVEPYDMPLAELPPAELCRP